MFLSIVSLKAELKFLNPVILSLSFEFKLFNLNHELSKSNQSSLAFLLIRFYLSMDKNYH